MMQIAEKYADFITTFEAAGGEITDEQFELFEREHSNFENKAEAYLAVIDKLDANQAQSDEEAKIAKAYSASCAKSSQALKLRLAYAMKLAKMEKCKAGFRSVSISKGKPSLVIDDEALVPLIYKLTVTPEPVTSIDKDLLKKYLLAEENAAVTGARISTGPDTVRIYKPRKKEAAE